MVWSILVFFCMVEIWFCQSWFGFVKYCLVWFGRALCEPVEFNLVWSIHRQTKKKNINLFFFKLLCEFVRGMYKQTNKQTDRSIELLRN